MLSAGLQYSFSVYGSGLQTALGYSQRQISGIGTAANMGGYAAVFAGLFYDWYVFTSASNFYFLYNVFLDTSI